MSLQKDPSLVGSLRSVAANSFWAAVGSGFRYLWAAAASVLVANILGNKVFGEYAMVTSTVLLFGSVADLGASAARFVAAYRTFDPVRAGRSLGMSVQAAAAVSGLVSMLLVLLAPYLATRWLGDPGLTWPLQLATLAMVFTVMGSTLSGALRGLGLFKQMALIEMVTATLLTVLTVAGASLGRLGGAVVGFTLGSALRMLAYAVPVYRSAHSLRWSVLSPDAWQEAGPILHFSVPAFASGFLVTPVLWGLRVILVNSDAGYSEVGVFSAALQWQGPLSFLSGVLGMALLPSLSALFQSRDSRGLARLYDVSFGLLCGVQLIVSACLILLSRSIAYLYGPGFEGLTAVLPLVFVAAFYGSVLSVPGQLLAAMNRMWLGLGLNIVWSGALLLIALRLVPSSGATGAGLSYVFAYVVHSFTTTAAMIRIKGWRFGKTMVSLLVPSTLALAGMTEAVLGSQSLAVGFGATIIAVFSVFAAVRVAAQGLHESPYGVGLLLGHLKIRD